MKKNNKNVSTGAAVAIGAGVLALAAGSYYFFGPEGKKNRGNLKGWMIRMKGEVIEKMEEAKDLTETVYEKIVDAVALKYAKAGRITEEEIRSFADSLKRQWKGIEKNASQHKAKGAVKKAPAKKKATKKAAKKKSK